MFICTAGAWPGLDNFLFIIIAPKYIQKRYPSHINRWGAQQGRAPHLNNFLIFLLNRKSTSSCTTLSNIAHNSISQDGHSATHSCVYFGDGHKSSNIDFFNIPSIKLKSLSKTNIILEPSQA